MHETDNVQKVVAYITQGTKLLVFRHTEHPEAGIQVPTGTISAGETPEEAVLRESEEETGLINLKIQAYLGEQMYDLAPFGRDEVVKRYFYHLTYNAAAPLKWRHYEMTPSEGSKEPIEFELYWVEYPNDVPELSGNLDVFLGQLDKHLHRRSQ